MSSLWTSVRRKAKGRHLLIIFSLALFSLLFATQSALNTIPIRTFSNLTSNHQPSAGFQLKQASPVTLVLILCNDDPANDPVSNSSRASKKNIIWNFQRQINQGVVLLKSIVILEAFFQVSSTVPVEVLVLSDRFENFQRLDEAIREGKWAAEFRERISLTFVPAAYPSGTEWMRKLFRPCATLRLFLDQLLPSYDSVIYVDTDFIFLRPISELWSEFDNFSPKALVAIAPCLSHYGTKRNKVPFYGQSGLTPGVMPMNLTRIRQTNWFSDIRQISEDFSNQIILADQDILNIYFNANPTKVHQLSCDWNFRPTQCMKGSFCSDWQVVDGISALHGTGSSFATNKMEPAFLAVFSAIQRFNLTSSSHLEGLSSSLREEVERVRLNKTVKSRCARYKAFRTILLNRMNSRASQFNENI